MLNSISDITPVTPLAPIGGSASAATVNDFKEILRNAVQRVESSRVAANEAVEKFITGEDQDLHTTMLANQKASLDFDLLLQVRNKVVQGYQEVMRMQL